MYDADVLAGMSEADREGLLIDEEVIVPEEVVAEVAVSEEVASVDDKSETYAPSYAAREAVDPAAAKSEYAQAKAVADLDRKGQLEAMDKMFEDGEINQIEYNRSQAAVYAKHEEVVDQAREALSKAEQDFTTSRTKAEISSEMASQRRDWEEENYFSDKDGAGPRIAANPLLYAAMDKQVRILTSNPANQNKPWGKILREAGDEVTKLMGGEPKIIKPPKFDPATLPPSLSGVAAAAANKAGAGEYDNLDSLTGLEYEAAVAKLMASNPEKAKAYLHS